VRFDKRRGTWNYLWYEAGKRRSRLIGTRREFPTKAAAWQAAQALTATIKKQREVGCTLTARALVAHYREEKMPKRTDTRRSYDVWLRNHILPRWGDSSLTELQARLAELWLGSLALSPKSKAAHTRFA